MRVFQWSFPTDHHNIRSASIFPNSCHQFVPGMHLRKASAVTLAKRNVVLHRFTADAVEVHNIFVTYSFTVFRRFSSCCEDFLLFAFFTKSSKQLLLNNRCFALRRFLSVSLLVDRKWNGFVSDISEMKEACRYKRNAWFAELQWGSKTTWSICIGQAKHFVESPFGC